MKRSRKRANDTVVDTEQQQQSTVIEADAVSDLAVVPAPNKANKRTNNNNNNNSNSSNNGISYSSFQSIQSTILSQLSPHYIPTKLIGLSSQYNTLMEILIHTIEGKQNNTVVLLGYSGSGKTTLLSYCFNELRAIYKPKGRSFIIITITGSIQYDDTAALREIVRQLTLDHELIPLPSNYSFHQLLEYIKLLLSSNTYNSIPIYIILNQFELFANRTTKQTLLYNLSDLLQSSTAQLCLIGKTTVLSAYDLLEKRIKSRMIYRKIIIYPNYTTKKDSNNDSNNNTNNSTATSSSNNNSNSNSNNFKLLINQRLTVSNNTEWNQLINTVFNSNTVNNTNNALNDTITYYSNLGKTSKYFLTALILMITQLKPANNDNLITVNTIQEQYKKELNYLNNNINYGLEYSLLNLTQLELTVLIGLLHCQLKSMKFINFNLIYKQYLQYINTNSNTSTNINNNNSNNNTNSNNSIINRYSKKILLHAFSTLIELGLIVYMDHGSNYSSNSSTNIDSTNTELNIEFRPIKLLLSESELRSCLKDKSYEISLSSWLSQWAFKITTE